MEGGLCSAQSNSFHGGWCTSATFDELLTFDQSRAVTNLVVRSTPAFGDVHELWLIVVGGRRATMSTPPNAVTFAGLAPIPFIEAHTLGHEPFRTMKRTCFAVVGSAGEKAVSAPMHRRFWHPRPETTCQNLSKRTRLRRAGLEETCETSETTRWPSLFRKAATCLTGIGRRQVDSCQGLPDLSVTSVEKDR